MTSGLGSRLDSSTRQKATNPCLRVLIIDDDPLDRVIFKQYLDEGGAAGPIIYAEAGTGREGLKKVKDFKPDCVLLDFQLPDLDGLSIVRMLHEGYEFLPCAVVMLTGIGSEQVAVDAMKLGVMDYMAKGPASAEALSRSVASAVQRFRLQQEVVQSRKALEQRNRELEATRAELFEEKERYRTMTEAIPQLVWTANSDGWLEYGNQRLWYFSGKPASQPCTLESLIHPDDKAVLRQRWGEGVLAGRPFECELRLRRAHDQTWRSCLMRTAPIRTNEEGSFKWFGTFTDIDDQRRAEEALRQRQKLDSIGRLAGGIAHDFNNLLVGVMGGASFALDALDPAHPAHPMLQIVLRSSERAANLTQQLLAYAGRGQTIVETVNISKVASDSCELVRTSIPSAVRIEVDTEENIPPIKTNSGQMQQVIINLLMNAAEAIGENEGLVRVKTGVETLQECDIQTNVLGYQISAGQYIAIEVMDSGVGIDEHLHTQIFDPFFTTKFTGRGLGLAAVQGIVRTLGGAIWVRSARGKGATFRVLLPVHPAGRSSPFEDGRQPGRPAAA
jgi:PAS domain S-box-containing protein